MKKRATFLTIKFMTILLIFIFVFSSVVYADKSATEKYNEVIKDIEKLDKDIQVQNKEYEKVSKELLEARTLYNLQMDISKKHIKYIYENTLDSTISNIFEVDSYAKINANIENFRAISKYDNKSIKRLRKAKNKVAKTEKELKKIKKELDAQMKDLLAKKKKAEDAIAKEAEEKRAEMIAYLNSFGVSSVTLGNNDVNGENASSLNYMPAESETMLLAATLEAEAGPSNYNANAAVATVICNRIASPLFPNTIYDVLVQARQFSTVPVKVSQILNSGVSSISIKAAQNAINGERVQEVGPRLYFCSLGYAISHGIVGINIGGNIFH